jgi:hypothetical protein
LSTQVLQELSVSVTREIPKPINDDLATNIVKDGLIIHSALNSPIRPAACSGCRRL